MPRGRRSPSRGMSTRGPGRLRSPVPVIHLFISELCKPGEGSVPGAGIVGDSWEGLHFNSLSAGGVTAQNLRHIAMAGTGGRPLDPVLYDEGIQLVGFEIQSEPAIGAGAVVAVVEPDWNIH